MAKILSKLFLLLLAVVGGVVHAIHDPAFTGIKTKPYRRDPSIAQAFEQQQLQQQYPNSRNYQVTNVDAAEGLSAIYNQNHNIQYHQQKQQQRPQGHYHHQKEKSIHQRNLQERHLASAPQNSNLNSADNAITEYYTGCPVQFTGQLPYAYDCRRFLNCWNGRGHIQSCAAGTVFNPETFECDRPDKVLCGVSSSLTGLATQHQKQPSPDYRAGRLMDATIDLCPAGITGLQPHPTDCTKFVNCANGHAHIQECGPGTAYSVPMMVCDFKDKVDCGAREIGVVTATRGQTESRSPYASSRQMVDRSIVKCPPGVSGLLPHPKDCTKFLQCSHDDTIVQNCAPGTAFDSMNMVCDFKEKVSCTDHIGVTEMSGFSSSDRAPIDITCPANITGLFPYPFDYTKFLNCKYGNTAIQNCVPGSIFSISKRFCDSKEKMLYTDHVLYIVSEVSYEYSQVVSYCPPGTDGIHLYPFDCGKYVKCVDSHMMIMDCAPGSVFSIATRSCLPMQQVSADDRVRYLTEILEQLVVITTANAGTYPSYNDAQQTIQCPAGVTGLFSYPFDCTKYLYCVNGKLLVETCSSGSVFSLSRKHCHSKENIDEKDMICVSAEYGIEWSAAASYGYSEYGYDTAYVVCPQSAIGSFLHPFDCTKYLQCENGQTTIEYCENGAIYSISRRHCISRDQVEAFDRVEYLTNAQHEFSRELDFDINQSDNIACPSGFDGLSPHPFDCTKYLKCTMGRTQVESCSQGMIFSLSKRYCDFEKNVNSNDRSTFGRSHVQESEGSILYNRQNASTTITHSHNNSNSVEVSCPSDTTTAFYPHPRDCTKFLNCQNGVVHIQSCSPGTAWSIDMMVCDLKERVDCTWRTSTDNVNVALETQTIACPADVNGLYPHPFDYKQYFICQLGSSMVQSCHPGSVFSISKRWCSPESQVMATDRVTVAATEIVTSRTQTCPSKATGLHLYPFDCTKFIRCDNGRTLIETCSPGAVFSLSKKLCVSKDPAERSDFTETQLSSGWETNYSRTVGNLSCPSGLIGFYQHPYDWTKFLNCANGQTVIEKCPRDTVFSVSKKFCDLEVNVVASDRSNNGIPPKYDNSYSQTTALKASSFGGGQSGYQPACPQGASGTHSHPYDCTKFINCANGVSHIQECAPGTAWNVALEICDFEEKVDCSGRHDTSRDSKMHNANFKGSSDSTKVSCPDGASGMRPHPFDCTKFLNCANDITHIQDCGPGTAWNIAMEVCDFIANVDCSNRIHEHSYGNRGSKSYVAGEGSQNNRWVTTDATLNQPAQGEIQPVNRDYNTQFGSHHTSNSAATHTDGGYGDRWSNMNRPRPEANAQQHTSTYGVTSQTTASTASVPTWSGEGSSIHRLTPSQSVLYVEGSLQPNRNYVNSIKSYSAPLAPFAPVVSDAAATTTKTNIYYTQPVDSDEDSQETFHNITGPPTGPNLDNSYIDRQNHSKEINHPASVNHWPPQAQPVQVPHQYLMPPHRSITVQTPISSQDFIHDINVPPTYLKPPLPSDEGQRLEKESESRVTSINLDRLPGNAEFDLSVHAQYPSGAHATPTVPLDASNLYGGLKPPLPPTPPEQTTTLQPNYYGHKPQSYHSIAHAPVDESNLYGGLQPPPPEPSNTNLPSRSNVRINQIYPPIVNATVHKLTQNPHYSHSYAGVAHSRNTTWSTAPRKVPQYPSTPVASTAKPGVVYNSQGAIYSSPLQQDYDGATLITTTERYGISPQPYNRQYYKTTTSLQPNDETVLDDDHMNQLPISDALRMLLRPYFNRSGTVDVGTAKQAESHIMKLVSPPTTIQITSDPYITTTRRPTTTPVQEDVELILAGEQHSLTNVATQSGTHEVRTEFHLNQENSKVNPENSNSNWQKPEHSRHFHLRHPQLPNPFTEGERSSAAPQHTHLHRQHSRDFHLRHPNVPNPFAAAREGGADEGLYDTPNPNAESTTPASDIYYNIDLRTGTPADECQFDCGNGKCIKNFEVCNGVNNCGNRQDESRCSHLGYEVRLTGGESSNMGRIEVKILGKWGLVCDDKFGLRDADVVCRELGFNLGASEVRGNSYYSPLEVNFSFAMDEVDCRGNETSLKDCEFKGWGVNNCGPDEVVGVVCKVPLLKCPNNYWLCSTSKECIPPTFVCDNTPDCADQSDESELVCNSPIEYRLEGGRSVNEGRLEIKYRGEWGSVCDDDFGVKEAQVVCNSLGFYGKPKIAKNVFGPGSGPIWLDQVSCFGNESSIDKCNHWTWGEHNCNHTEDVGIKCTAGPPPRISTRIDIMASADNDQHAADDGHSRLEDIGLYSGRLERSSKFTTNQRRCGHFKDDIIDEYDHPEERVVNGTRAKRGRHPWQATIRTRGRGGISGHWCGAVLISKKHLLTAAHCLAGYPKGAYFVRMGDHYANIAESSEIDSYIENWYIHEKFRDTTHMNNDIALIVLKHSVRFNDYIQPICLPENDTPMQENRMCTISGWGSIKSGVSTPSNILRAAQLPILAEAVCKQPHVYGGSMTEGMFCAGSMDESVDACDGDSGGPLVCSDDAGDTLYGIISWGQHCGYANKPGVYVRVGKYIDWIYDKINFSIEKAGS